MIDGLVGGKLVGNPTSRVGQSGKAFYTAKVRAAAADGDSIFVNVITFSDSVGAQLLTLEDGDSVSLAGTLSPKAWVDRNGEARPALDMVVQSLVTPYHVSRKRQAMNQDA